MIRKMMSSGTKWKPRYFDIGVNFSDAMFQGCYNGKSRHSPDVGKVIERAHVFNVQKMLITASTIKESKDHFLLCRDFPQQFYSTAGVHPCSVASEFYVKNDDGYSEELRPDVEEKLAELKHIVETGVSQGFVRAFGEIGLDYDRFHYSSKNQQITMFTKQLELIADLKHLHLPLFLHMRSACLDFVDIVKPFIENGSIAKGNGVVHSFTGTQEELDQLIDLGFYISVNGCSLREESSLPVAARIPRDKLMIETDAPWCEVKRTHASYQYLTPYPNKFYPLVSQNELETFEKEDTDSLNEKKKKQNNGGKKNAAPTYHEFLPYPSIKKENFEKHLSKTELKLKGFQDPDSIDNQVGEFAHPLVKSRNEPVFVGLIAEIMCGLYGLTDEKDIEDLIDQVYENSCKLFKV